MECFKLHRIWLTVKQMCNDRGYDVDDADLELSLDGWIERFGDAPKDNNPGRKNLNFLVYHDKDAMNRMFVLFAEQHTVTGDDLKAYMAKMKDGSVERAIIVYENKITPMARNQMDEMRNMADGIEGRKYFFEVFKDKELMINVTRHELVPKHAVLVEEEKQTLLKRYGLKETELGQIQRGDPVARYFGMSKGQVFKIVRSSQTAGRYVSYRIVR